MFLVLGGCGHLGGGCATPSTSLSLSMLMERCVHNMMCCPQWTKMHIGPVVLPCQVFSSSVGERDVRLPVTCLHLVN